MFLASIIVFVFGRVLNHPATCAVNAKLFHIYNCRALDSETLIITVKSL